MWHSLETFFGNERYDKADQFPLLYVSQCSKQRHKGLKDVCFVERISLTGEPQLVQTIVLNDKEGLFGYALQWIIDNKRNLLIGYGNTVENLNFNIVAFGPADIHAEQHFGPVATFGAARTGVDVQNRVEGVLLVAHHVLEFQLLHGLHRLVVGLVQLCLCCVARLLELTDNQQLIVQLGSLVFNAADLLQQLLGGLGVVPKAVFLCDFFFFFDFLFFGIYVKDTSLAH